MTFAETDIAKGVSPEVIKYIETVYSRGTSRKSLEERQAEFNIEETPEIRKLIAYYMSYFVYDNEFMTLVSKEILFRESSETIREPVSVTDEDKRLKMVDLKSKADAVCDKLLGDIKRLRGEIYGALEQEGQKVVQQALTPEDRIKRKSK